MGVDLELLAAGDASLLLDDAATDELCATGQEDDAMRGVWDALDAQDGGGQHWWELALTDTPKLREAPAVHAAAEAPPSISPVAMEAKQAQILETKVDKRKMKLSDDSGSDAAARKTAIPSMVTRSRSKSAAVPVIKLEPGHRAVKTQVKGKAKAQRKRRPSAAKSGSTSPKKEVVREEKPLTPLEIRRKRNRESMQRARRRQRDDVERMKGTLQQLEKHYQELNEQSQARRRLSSSEGNDRESLSLEAEYYALADLSHSLKEEKFLLEQMLVDKQKTHRRLQQVMVDRKQELDLACPLTTDDVSLFSDYEYLPMTEDQVNERIRTCYQQMRSMEETGRPLSARYEVPDGDDEAVNGSPCSPTASSSSSCSKSDGQCPFPPSATFGWEVRTENSPNGDFYVSFAKFFAGITPQQAMMASWTRYAKPESTPFRRQLRFEVLQVINDSTYIAGQDIEHPVEHNKVMRMIFMNFRMQTDKGFVIGRHSVNPTSPEVRRMAEKDSGFEYVDSSNWVEFVAAEDEQTGEPGCRVKFIARTEYNTQEDMYVRLVNSISRTMIWELAVVPSSSLSLLPHS